MTGTTCICLFKNNKHTKKCKELKSMNKIIKLKYKFDWEEIFVNIALGLVVVFTMSVVYVYGSLYTNYYKTGDCSLFDNFLIQNVPYKCIGQNK